MNAESLLDLLNFLSFDIAKEVVPPRYTFSGFDVAVWRKKGRRTTPTSFVGYIDNVSDVGNGVFATYNMTVLATEFGAVCDKPAFIRALLVSAVVGLDDFMKEQDDGSGSDARVH